MRICAVLLAVVVAVPVLAGSEFGWPVVDTDWPQTQWRPLYQRAMEHNLARRMLVGYPDFTVQAERVTTRYEWAAVVSRLVHYFEVPLPGYEYLPPDVPWDHWCTDACQVWVASRLYPTAPTMNFRGERALSRGEFAFTMLNLMRLMEGETPPATLLESRDIREQAGELLRQRGILVGYPDGLMHLDHAMPRWQVAVAVYRLLLWSQEQTGAQPWGPARTRPTQP